MPSDLPLLYITSLSYPSRKATNIQVAANAREFQRLLGTRFVLAVSEDGQGELKDLHPVCNHLGRLIPWHLSSIGAFFWLPKWIHKQAPQGAFLYFKDFKLATIALFWNKWLFRQRYRIAVEVHHYDGLLIEKHVLRQAHVAFCITTHLKKIVETELPSASRLTALAPDGADPGFFAVHANQAELRRELGLPMDTKLIGYTGAFQTKGFSKGIETAIETLKHLPMDFELVVVGGEPQEIEERKKQAVELGVTNRVMFVGRVSHDLIPKYLASFDYLFAPYPNNRFNALYTSPLKLFEYMAARKPLFIADLPSIRDILDESTAYLCAADDAQAYAQAIIQAEADRRTATEKADRAFDLLKTKYTWQARARNIIQALYGHLSQ